MKKLFLAAVLGVFSGVCAPAQSVVIADGNPYGAYAPYVYASPVIYQASVVYMGPVVYQAPVIYQTVAPAPVVCERPSSSVLIIGAQGGVSYVDYRNSYSPCDRSGSQVIFFGGRQARTQGYSFGGR